jgi:tryptophanyl-tRNA synthetase
MNKPTILTGLRANNDLHIGNYFGALLPLVDMAKNKSVEYQINLFVPDLHSFTTPINHDKLQEQIMNNLRLFVASGLPIDHPDVHLYRQSYVSAHSELTWIFDCFTGIGEMSRMTEYKDKAAKLGDERVSVGLFNYPVLMATDVLLYNAIYVPVGDDQSQHLEYSRDISMRFNAKFNQEIFVVPYEVKKQHEFFGNDQGLRIKDLVDPNKKMSKSDESGRGIIFLGDDPDEAYRKIMGATTDNEAKVQFNPESQPGVSNLLQIYALLKSLSVEKATQEFAGQTQYGEFKKVVAEAIANFLQDFQSKLAQVDQTAINQKLGESEKAMNIIANATLLRVQKAVGLRA